MLNCCGLSCSVAQFRSIGERHSPFSALSSPQLVGGVGVWLSTEEFGGRSSSDEEFKEWENHKLLSIRYPLFIVSLIYIILGGIQHTIEMKEEFDIRHDWQNAV